MTMLCGTDFSPSAAEAADAAAAMAKALGTRLELVHVVGGLWPDLLEPVRAPLVAGVRDRLRAEADRLRARGVIVQEEVLDGLADEELVRRAERVGARLIVVASTGRRAPARWLLGSVAERTAQSSPVPVMVVRRASPLVAWAEGKRRLRVMVAVDFSGSAEAALHWVTWLRAIGPCDVVVAYSSWPPGERGRLGTSVRPTGFELDPDVEAALRSDLERKAAGIAGEGEVRVRVESCLGQAAAHLVDMAIEEDVDLLVTGTHQRDRGGRLWHGSVSRGILHAAPMNVACVPRARRSDAAPVPPVRSVLAATDFSELGDRAVRFAYAIVPPGGTVHLAHVVETAGVPDAWYVHHDAEAGPGGPERSDPEGELTRQLQSLVPADAATRRIETRIHLIEARTAGAGITMAARRLDVDLICVGSHGRSGLAAAFLGSVAQSLIARSGRPVLIVGPGP
jgi:nucleotide-binding universal stress UspA family protein